MRKKVWTHSCKSVPRYGRGNKLNQFTNKDEAILFLLAVLRDEALNVGEQIADLDVELLKLSSEELSIKQTEVAEQYGAMDDGWVSKRKMVRLLNIAVKNNQVSNYHHSGLKISDLLKDIETMLDRRMDLAWIVVHDAVNKKYDDKTEHLIGKSL